ncbi:MAG: hypothetical protein K0U41_08640 [Gammaproteobacteria bacterium]|nr:hypothetical protein [Gammaproteobacteria bacterium]
MSIIKLSEIIKTDNLHDYKLHAARKGVDVARSHPLDDYAHSLASWEGWNTWRTDKTKDDFNRRYIFSLMDFYHEPNMWLFGGIFEVLSRGNAPIPSAGYYGIERVHEYSKWVGRLKINFTLKPQTPGKSFKLEEKYDQLNVIELFRYPYPKTSWNNKV